MPMPYSSPRRCGIPLALVSLLALLVTPPSAAAGASTMPVSEIRPGMKGVGRTVFTSDRIETFQVDIIGVMPKVAIGRDLILARLSGGPLAHTGVIAGMSGSPIYIEGRLIGALSTGWALAKDAIAGITPIDEMLPLMEGKPAGARPQAPAGQAPAGQVPAGQAPAQAPTGQVLASPLATPVYFSGFNPGVVEAARAQLEKWNLTPVLGSAPMNAVPLSVEDQPVATEALEPGGVLSVIVAEGDLSVAAVGTMTYRDGDRLLGFGHPFLGLGPVCLPVGSGRILALLPNYLISFKMGAASGPIGALLHDGSTGVYAKLGVHAEQTALTVKVRAYGQELVRTVKVARHAQLTPLILTMASASLVLDSTRVEDASTVKCHGRLELTDGSIAQFSDVQASRALGPGHLIGLMEPLRRLYDNPIKRVEARQVLLEFDVEPEARTAQLDSIRLNKSRYRRGEKAELTATLRTYDGGLVSRTVSFTLPGDLEPAPATLEVMDSMSAEQKDRNLNPARYNPKDLPGLLNLIQGRRASTSLWGRLSLPREGVSLDGKELPRLPGSLLAVFGAQGAPGATKLTSEVEVELPTGLVVTGQDALAIEILPEVER